MVANGLKPSVRAAMPRLARAGSAHSTPI